MKAPIRSVLWPVLFQPAVYRQYPNQKVHVRGLLACDVGRAAVADIPAANINQAIK